MHSLLLLRWWLALVLLVPLIGRAAPAPVENVIQYLSGTGPDNAVAWEFYCTAGRNSRVWTTIPVPSNWEQHGFGDYNYGGETRRSDGPIAHEQGLYRHRFTVPADWAGRAVRIVFEASMTDTSVWINGQSAGPTHHGGFYRFHYDVSSLLHYGQENVLEVTVSKVSAIRSVNDAERAADYWIFGGIFRPVWLEAAPPLAIERTAIDARADGTFRADVYLTQPAPAGGLTVTGQITRAAGAAVGAPVQATVPAGATHTTVRGAFGSVATWTAETPHLHHVRFVLSAPDARPLHQRQERFGFRTFEVREKDGLYLNGTKIVLKGVNRHCFWPETARAVSREQSYRDARLIKAANFNAVRMSHYPPDPHFLEACDELGLYVLNELAGWQSMYATATGRRLIGQLVRRDVNHPSILFWNNGNEGGWNTENDGEFAKWDPQQRRVLHPWDEFSGIDTNHYEDYASTVKLSAGPTLFMPTEFLHGLYDGGSGTGLRDYWDVMGRSPTVTGGFLWVWADEGVVRTDRDGAIDNAGNLAPDGVVGPHRQPEGSYYSVKEVWSPVQVTAPAARVLPPNWDGTVSLRNDYSFTPLEQCSLQWQLITITPAGRTLAAEGRQAAPAAPPGGGMGTTRLNLPSGWHSAGETARVLQVAVLDPAQQELWRWSWLVASPPSPMAAASANVPQVQQTGDLLRVQTGDALWRFDRRTGHLSGTEVAGAVLPLARGPRLVAHLREDRVFRDVAGESRLIDLGTRTEADGTVVVEARYEGALQQVTWRIQGRRAELSYAYAFTGPVNVLGVEFDYPEASVQRKAWLGRGPYRAYQNRRDGGLVDLWQVDYNDPIPGETYAVPEFAGYFDEWSWLRLDSTEGRIQFANVSGVPFHGLYRAQTGRDGLLHWPPLGVALLDVIPAQRTKFLPPERLGPTGQTPEVAGLKSGRVIILLEPPTP